MTQSFSYPNKLIRSLSNILAEKRFSYGKKAKEQLSDVEKPITSASPEVQQIIERVLQAEKDRLYTQNSRGINDDILKIINEEIPE
ncbi:hypothetical protein IQ235_02310 [Oscillatoriales cyanobacterium LEGE 11467]|uniref:Uncharacterized protein n=1 Tax=Zarconia navalis LEGE 11467 TaxID=1828826 RepID=A0A928VWV1_9CYAN|nr:hypothetical protein [Zarconia navalis]MBE9039628.1 hypothetical protein [Zarconia navalis LEGE 11467]